jgi:hypothetical protein
VDVRYFWVSISKIVSEGVIGNLGAIILKSENELSKDDIEKIVRERDDIPYGPSLWMVELPDIDESKFEYPIDTFMSREELLAREDVVNVRSRVNMCYGCAEKLNEDPREVE